MIARREFFNAPTADLVIPKRLIDRDPRNPLHVSFALAVLAKLGDMVITERTKRELTSLGIAPPKWAKIVKRINQDEHDWVLCAFFLLEIGLQFPDNQITTCHVCKTALQLRPESASSKGVKLCYFCAVDRLLDKYWKTHRPAPPQG